jgi:hypothetical protein
VTGVREAAKKISAVAAAAAMAPATSMPSWWCVFPGGMKGMAEVEARQVPP